MNPDLEKRVPREILAELIEEGTEAFRGILEKLVQRGHAVGKKRVSGSGSVRENSQSARLSKRIQGKRIQTRVGELHLEIPQVRGLRFYPKSLRGVAVRRRP